MSELDNIKNIKEINQRFGEKLDATQRMAGKLGNTAGYVSVSGRANYVYVDFGTHISEVLNKRGVPKTFGLAVTCGYPVDDPGQFQVLGTRGETPAGVGVALSAVVPHGDTHVWGGSDPVLVDVRQILPGRIRPGGGMYIEIYRHIIWTGTRFVLVPTERVDMTSYRPSTAGKCKLVLVTVDNTGDVIFTASSELDLSDLTTDPLLYCPEPPDNTVETLGVVRVYTGQTKISETKQGANDLGDLRFTAYVKQSSGGHLIQDNGTDMPQRSKLNFIGVTVADDEPNDQTDVTIAGAGAAVITTRTIQVRECLFDSTLTSASAGWNSGTLPQTYTDLAWTIDGKSTHTDYTYAKVVISGDATATNYYYARQLGGTTGTSGGGINSNYMAYITGSDAAAAHFSHIESALNLYTDTTMRKVIKSTSDIYDPANYFISEQATSWIGANGTNAVTSLDITCVSGSFVAGSRLRVWGIKEIDVVTNVTGGELSGTTSASSVSIDTTNLDVILSSADTDVQKAMETIDGHRHDASYDAIGSAVVLSAIRIYTSGSATWTKPTGLHHILIKGTGGGGSGGGVAATGAGEVAASTGGGAAGYFEKIIYAADLGSTETVTIGAGAAAPSAGNNAGNTGNTTSFGTHCSATGGGPGVGGANTTGSTFNVGGDGGTATGGNLNIPGQSGGSRSIVDGQRSLGGAGGSNPLGSGGKTGLSVNGQGGQGYGSGGGGVISVQNQSARSGGDGAIGEIVVYEYTEVN
jgi:hypothetical protein